MANNESSAGSNNESGNESLQEIRADRKFFGHPRGVGVLTLGNFCNSGAWGAFYAILVVYLYSPWIQGLGFSHGNAAMLVTAMGVGNSILVIVGSWLADRVLGMRKALIIGNLLKTVGMGLFALPVPSQNLGRGLAFVGLLLLAFPIMGASNYSLTGQMYNRSDNKRRDSAFTVYGIVGSLASVVIPVLAAQIGLLNYHIGFAIGALFAFLYGASIFVTQHKFFGTLGAKPTRPLSSAEKKKFTTIAIVAVVAVLVVIAFITFSKLVSFNQVMSAISSLAFIIPIAFLINLFHKKSLKKTEKKHLQAFLWFYCGQVLYSIGATLLTTAVVVFIDAKIQKYFFGIEIAPGSVQTIYAIIGLIIGPVMIFLWNRTKLGGLSTVVKYGAGLLFYVIAYGFLAIPVFLISGGARHSVLWVVLFYVFVTICDQLLGAIGFSTVAQLAPEGEETQMQTAWGQGPAIANGIVLVAFLKFQSIDQQMLIFPIMMVVFAVAFVIFILNTRRINRLMAE